LSKGSFLQMQN